MKKILIADDEPMFLNMLLSFLEQEGYEVKKAADGLEVLNILKTWQPDLLLTDISMPHLTGRDLIITLKKQHPALPVVVVSGKMMKGDVEIALAGNVKGYLYKPFRFEDLEAILVQLLESGDGSDIKTPPIGERPVIKTPSTTRDTTDVKPPTLERTDTTRRRIFWDSNPDRLLNKTLGRVMLVELLGLGGMGGIFKGHHLSLDKTVAVKVLYQSLAQNPTFVGRFLREARTAAQLDHPNIVRIFDVDCYIDIHYIVMEYLQGEDLLKRLKHKGRLCVREALKIILQVAEGLSNAHNAGIIHRDIKPANLIICQGERVKIIDFGLTRSYLSDSLLTESGQVLGTPHYMSPEQCRGENLDPRSDIYSLGITFYQILSGKLPFEGSPQSVIAQQLTVDPAPIEKLVPNISDHLARVVAKMMAKDRQQRYQNMSELLYDLASAF